MSMDGPAIPPASGGPARQLVVFLHGVGADGHDLIGLAPSFAEILPHAMFLSPDAPFACDMAPFGRQWFSLLDRRPQAVLDGVLAAAPLLDDFLDDELGKLGLGLEALALVGFSQGTMMGLHTALRRQSPIAALVGFSGMLVGGADLLARQIAARPPVLLVHGTEDPVVPFACLEAARSALAGLAVPVQSLACPGLGHSIDENGLTAAVRFLERAFAGR